MVSSELEIVARARDQTANMLPKLQKEVDQLGKRAGSASSGLERFSKAASGLGSTLSRASVALGLVATPLIGIGVASIKMAMDAVESENLFEVSMGEMAGAARQFSEELRNQLGLNAFEVRKSVGTLNVMVSSMGIGKDAAFTMAKGLTQLSADMASFYNLKPDEAFGKLQAAISGESEPLKRLGIVINETTSKQWALNKGLIKQGEEMSEAQKVVARYGAIMEATSKAQGDLARTADSPANQARRMRAEFSQLTTEIGMQFLPAMSTALTWVNNVGLPAVRKTLGKLRDAWSEMSDVAHTSVIAAAALLVAGGPLLKGVSVAISGVRLIAQAFLALAAFVPAKIVLIGAVIVGLAETARIAAHVILHWLVDSVGSGLNELGLKLVEMTQLAALVPGPLGDAARMAKSFGAAIANAGNALKGWERSGRFQKDNDLIKSLTKRYGEMAGAVGDAGSAIGNALTPEFDRLLAQAQTLTADFGAGTTAIKAQTDEIDKLALAESLWNQAATDATAGADKQGKAAEKAAISIGDLSAALIATHPATLAAASAVAYWTAEIEAANLALAANRDQLKAAQADYDRLGGTLKGAQAEYQAMSDRLGELNRQLSDAKARFADLSSINLKGMGESAMQIEAVQNQLKRVKLAETLGAPLDQIIARYPLLTKGSEAYLSTLPKTAEELQKILDGLQLGRELGLGSQQQQLKEFQENLSKLSASDLATAMKTIGKSMADIQKLTPAEQLKLMAEVAKQVNKELTFAEAVKQIISTKGEIDSLTGAITAQEAAMRSQKAVIDSIQASMEAQRRVIEGIQAAGEALNATLAILQEELRGAEAKQRLVNDALTIAYDWFLKDREKIIEMGGAASEVAETMDAKTRDLLSAVSQAATDTTSTSTATLASMVLAYKKDMAIAVSEVATLKGQLAAIPRDITTIHTTIHKDVYEGGGNTGTTTTTTPLGTYASGTAYVPQTGPYILHQGEAIIPAGRQSAGQSINITMTVNVQGSVTAERDLAETVRRELLRVKSRNTNTGL